MLEVNPWCFTVITHIPEISNGYYPNVKIRQEFFPDHSERFDLMSVFREDPELGDVERIPVYCYRRE